MHPGVLRPEPGMCPICKMQLVKEQELPAPVKHKLSDFLPLITILIVVAVCTAGMYRAQHLSDPWQAMRLFMGWFFIIFSAFKLLNWKGFVEAFAMYDMVAKRSRVYAYAYPLIELVLGIGFLLALYPLVVAWATFVLMVVGSIGVAQELRMHRPIPCACLGVVFKIPMTYVTLAEDVLMALMAVVMILRVM